MKPWRVGRKKGSVVTSLLEANSTTQDVASLHHTHTLPHAVSAIIPPPPVTNSCWVHILAKRPFVLYLLYQCELLVGLSIHACSQQSISVC